MANEYTVSERHSPQNSDREFTVLTAIDANGRVRYGYREFDGTGRTRWSGFALSLEQIGMVLDTYYAKFPSTSRSY